MPYRLADCGTASPARSAMQSDTRNFSVDPNTHKEPFQPASAYAVVFSMVAAYSARHLAKFLPKARRLSLNSFVID
jgi:hypothetical protein